MYRHYLFPLLAFFLLLFSAPALAQKHSIRVHGTVLRASDKTPLPGVGIQILRSGKGTSTDTSGFFRIEILATDTLMLRGIGLRPVMYIPAIKSVNELRIRILMEEENVELPAVEISGRPSKEEIDRALRNMKPRPAPAAPRPNPTTVIRPTNPDAPPAKPTISNPASLLYEKFSKEGQQKQKLEEIEKQKQSEQEVKEKQDYNRFFKDNTGYE